MALLAFRFSELLPVRSELGEDLFVNRLLVNDGDGAQNLLCLRDAPLRQQPPPCLRYQPAKVNYLISACVRDRNRTMEPGKRHTSAGTKSR